MKKIFALILTLALCFTVFLSVMACTPKALPNFDVPEEGFDTETPIEITFTHTMGQTLEGILDIAIEDFAKLYPNITVTKQKLGTYDDVIDQINTQLGSGSEDVPNLAFCYPDHIATYNAYKAVATLDNLISSEIKVKRADGVEEQLGFTKAQLDEFVPAFYAEGTAIGDGLMYVLPLNKSTEMMYYNKTFFDAHKDEISVPDHWFANGANDKTSMEYVCQKIIEISKTEGKEVVPFGYDSEDNWFITLAEQMGAGYTTSEKGNYFTFDNKQNRDVMTKLNEWYRKGYFTTKSLNNDNNTSNLLTQTTKNNESRCYMSIGSTGGASYNIPNKEPVFETGIAPIPQMDPSNPKYILQGPDVCIFKKEDPQEVLASWLFLKFLTTNIDFQAGYSQKSGYMPVIKSTDNDEIYQAFLATADKPGNENLHARVVKQSIAIRDNCFTSPAFDGSAIARQEVGKMLVKIVSDTESQDVSSVVQKAFEDAIKECEYSQ